MRIIFRAFTWIDVVPILWISCFGYFFCRNRLGCLAFGRFFIELGHIEFSTFFEANCLYGTLFCCSCYIRTSFKNGRSFIVPIDSSFWHLHEGLDQVRLAISIRIIISFHIDNIADDVTLVIGVMLRIVPWRKWENRLCFAIQKERCLLVSSVSGTELFGYINHRSEISDWSRALHSFLDHP